MKDDIIFVITPIDASTVKASFPNDKKIVVFSSEKDIFLKIDNDAPSTIIVDFTFSEKDQHKLLRRLIKDGKSVDIHAVLLANVSEEQMENAHEEIKHGAMGIVSLPALPSTTACHLTAAQEYRRALSGRRRFLKSLRHDLRSPVSVISTAAQLLEAGICGPLSEEQGEVIIRISRSVDKFFAIVDELHE